MAEIPCVLEKDRCFNFDFDCSKILYHAHLNIFLLIGKTNEILVTDVNSGLALYKTTSKEHVTYSHTDGVCLGNKVLLTDGFAVGLRSDYNQILLLDTILQSPGSAPNEVVEIDLPLSEATELASAIRVWQDGNNDEVVFEKLSHAIITARNKSAWKDNNVEKWSLVTLKLPLNYIHQSVFNLAKELKQSSNYIPVLPIASAICERLYDLCPVHVKSTIKHFKMANELTRSASFIKCNYVDYRLVIPEYLAQSGFYHEVHSDGSETAVCFSCGSNVAYWEMDELWDNEKHAHGCRFINGDYTENVPLSTLSATFPAVKKSGHKIGTTSVPDLIALFCNDAVTIYECSKLLKEETSINIPISLAAFSDDSTLVAPLDDGINDGSQTMDLSNTPKNNDHVKVVTTCSLLGSTWYSSYLTELLPYEQETNIRIGEKEIDRIEDRVLKKVSPSLVVGVRHSVSGGKIGTRKRKLDNCSKERVQLLLIVYDIHYNLFQNVKVANRLNAPQSFDQEKKLSVTSEPIIPNDKTVPPISNNSLQTSPEKLNDYVDNDMDNTATFSSGGSLPSSNFQDHGFCFTDYISTAEAHVDKLLSSTDVFSQTTGDETVKQESSFSMELGTATSSLQIPDISDNASNTGYPTNNNICPDLIQIIPLEPCMPNNSFVISGIYPATTGCHLLVVLKQMYDNISPLTECAGSFMLYRMRFHNKVVTLECKPSSIRYLRNCDEIPVDIVMLPILQKCDDVYVRGSHIPRAAMVTRSGELQLWNLQTLDIIIVYHADSERFVSVTYCTGLDKLCAVTEHGKIYYFSIVGQVDVINRDQCGESEDMQPSNPTELISSKSSFTLPDLKKLYSLIHFDNMNTYFTAKMPPCWTEIKQGQKTRKHSLEYDGDSYTKTWKLQLAPNTRSEHMFELTLPYNAYIGHVDVKFSLRPPYYIPNVQVSLLRQKDGRGRTPKSGYVFRDNYQDNNGTPQNPVLNSEFNNTFNSELLCGPVNLKSYINVPELSGVVTLTSPYLFQQACRTVFIHLKSLDNKQNSESSTRCNETDAKKNPKSYPGCDNISEISITMRKTKEVSLHHDRLERYNMLITKYFTETLLKCYLSSTEYRYKILALDILTWVAAIRLTRCRVNDCLTEQTDYIYLFEVHLNDVIRCGLINGDRSLARKTVELLIILCEGYKSVNENDTNQFDVIVLNKLIEWLPQTLKCWSAGALRWFFSAVTHVANNDVKGILLHQIFSLLTSVGKELQKRKNYYHLLLRTRFGLYGCPFDAEIFEIEPYIPGSDSNFICSSTLNNPFLQLPDGGSFWNGFRTRTIDLKELVSKVNYVNAVKWDIPLADNVSIHHFMKGLTESEPLFFTCHSSSLNTMLEKSNDNTATKEPQTANSHPSTSMDDEMTGSVSSIGIYVPEHIPQEVGSINIPDSDQKSGKENKIMDNVIFMQDTGQEICPQFKISLIPKLKETTKTLLNLNVAKKLLLVSNKFGDLYSDGNALGPSSSSTAVVGNMLQTPTPLNYALHPTTAIPPGCLSEAGPHQPIVYHEKFGYYNSQNPYYYHQPQSSQHVQAAITKPSAPLKPVTTLYRDKVSFSDFFKKDDEDCFPWQQLTTQPLPQMIVIDKNGGDVRFVTLDFGNSVILTDIILPPCPDVLSIAIDVWLYNESESKRIVTCSDINVKLLLLSDIQPPPVCRYAKITVVGRYTVNNPKFRVPIGGFYGHIYTASEDFYFEEQNTPVVSQYSLTNLKALHSMIEDTRCKYELACSKLKERLTPLLSSDSINNNSHMDHYLNGTKLSESDSNETSVEIVKLYNECTTYQHHLNVLTFFLKRVTKSVADPLLSECCSLDMMIAYCGTSKMKLIAELLLELALYMSHYLMIDFVDAGVSYDPLNDYHITDMFYNICIDEDTRIQLSMCTLLIRLFTMRDWWGHFIVNSFCFLYSSNCLKVYPRERVFTLYAYMMRKSILMTGNQTHIVEHVLKALLKNLTPLSQTNLKGFVCGILDMELISWLLLLLIHCIEVLPISSKPIKNAFKFNTDAPIRWNFIHWETPVAHKRNLERRNAFRNFKKNTFPKKVYEGIEELDGLKKSAQDTINMINFYAQPHSSVKFSSAKKKANFSPLTSSCHLMFKGKKGVASKEVKHKNVKIIKLTIQKHNALPVAKALIALILQMDITVNVDMMIAACKVLALILQFSSSYIELSDLMTQQQLIKLVQISAWCENLRPLSGGKWASHAIVCLLADFTNKIRDKLYIPEFGVPGTSKDAETSTSSTSEVEICVMNDVSVTTNLGEGSSNHQHLPSLLESDDSEDLENNYCDYGDCNKPTKNYSYKQITPYPTTVSVTLDSRLQYGVELQMFIQMRRSLDWTANVLGSSLSAVPMLASAHKEFTFSMGDLALPWINNLPHQSENTISMFTTVFDHFLCSPNVRGVANNFEELLHLWLTLGGVSFNDDNVRLQTPLIPLSVLALSKIIETVATNADVSIKLWDLTFKTLSAASFLPYEHPYASSPSPSPSSSPSTSSCPPECKTPTYAILIIEHNDFQALISSFLSTTFPENLVGGGVVRSFRDMLARLNYHAVMFSPGFKVEQRFKKRLIDVLYELLDTTGAITQGRGPCDAQLCFVQTLTYYEYQEVNLSKVPGILLFVVNLLHTYAKRERFLICSATPDANSVDSYVSDRQRIILTPATRSNLIVNVVKASLTLLSYPLDYTTGLTDDIIELEYKYQFSRDVFDKRITLTDISLSRYENIVCNLLNTLSYCFIPSLSNCNGKSLLELLVLTTNSTVGDAACYLMIFLITKVGKSGLIMKPFMDYMTYHCLMYRNDNMVMQISDSLLHIIIKLLCNTEMLGTFIESGGVNMICENLKKCFSVVMNNNHSIVSSMMQYLYGPDAFNIPAVNNKSKKKFIDRTENGLINFAPLGTIITESPSSNPSPDVLLIPSNAYISTRATSWNYHFYPDEKDMTLRIMLPCAFLLRDVQIYFRFTPNTAVLSVSLEISRNNNDYISVNAPTNCDGSSIVNISLKEPEAVTSILLRFYKPESVPTISLSNIRLLGYSTFGEIKSSARSSYMLSDEKLTKISLTWLSLLYYCILTAEENEELLTAVVSSVGHPTLEVICGLISLPPPWPVFLIRTLKYVLTKLGSCSFEMGCDIIRLILWNGREQELKCGGRKLESITASNTAIMVLQNLCNIRDDKIIDRMKITLDWLDEVSSYCSMNNSIEFVTPMYIICISSILWKMMECNDDCDLSSIISPSLFRKLMELSGNLPTVSSLKRAVDKLLCSIYYIKPLFFEIYLCQTDVLEKSDSDQNNGHKLRNKSDLRLSEKDFATLSSVGLSSPAIDVMMKSEFLIVLLETISEFCKNNCSYQTFCEQAAKNNDEKTTFFNPAVTDKLPLLHINNVSAILNFLAELSWDGTMRAWLGSPTANQFWPDLMRFMCHRDKNSNLNRRHFPPGSIMKLEDAVINFFSRVCWCHSTNQSALVNVLCHFTFDHINSDNSCETSETKGLANFVKRILLELVLDEEKIFVSVSLEDNFDNIDLKQAPGTTFSSHPSIPCTSRHQLLYVNIDSTCQDIVRLITTPWKDNEVFPENKAELSVADHEIDLKDNLECDTCEISVAAGVTAKEKRAVNRGKRKAALKYKKKTTSQPSTSEPTKVMGTVSRSGKIKCRLLSHSKLSEEEYFSPKMSIRSILRVISECDSKYLDIPVIKLFLITKIILPEEGVNGILKTESLTSLLEEFTFNRGLEIVAHNLPLVLCPLVASSGRTAPTADRSKIQKTLSETIEDTVNEIDYWNVAENIFSVADEKLAAKLNQIDSNYPDRKSFCSGADNAEVLLPPHSLIAFGQFLKLPNYGKIFIKDRKTAICLLRLAIGANVNIEEFMKINKSHTLSTISFNTLHKLFKLSPMDADDGIVLRRYALELGAIHIVLSCLAVFTHHPEAIDFTCGRSKYSWILNIIKQYYSNVNFKPDQEKADSYWAKGTGFGTGSTSQSWNVEQALSHQKYEEENVVVFLRIISYYINPDETLQLKPNIYVTKKLTKSGTSNELQINSKLPTEFGNIISQSCLLQALSSYLHNDSVLDMARHVPLYQTILSLLRSMAVNPQLLHLLLPQKSKEYSSNSTSIIKLLLNVNSCISTYTSKLKNTNTKVQKQHVHQKLQQQQPQPKKKSSKISLTDVTVEDESLARLINDVQSTIKIIEIMAGDTLRYDRDGNIIETSDSTMLKEISAISIEESYIRTMKKLQFDSYDMFSGPGDGAGMKFNVSYHFISNVKADSAKYFHGRMKRLAQEVATLSTSLPLSYSSTVFVRYDTNRLDIMKVLITGPAETPYENGCFEFDVYFPPEYPSLPMLVNLETTGRHSVRFNPNLYNDGKVCLSILNTWHGRPEEKWNSHTSSFLQVLVSIQSLILVPEPYFNEPGYERSRGTDVGDNSSQDYNSNVYQATVRWAMLQQLRSPTPCFKQIIQTHFWFKRQEIVNQICAWITDLERDVRVKRTGKNFRINTSALKNNFKLLCDELEKLPTPQQFKDLASRPEFKFVRPDSKFITSTSVPSTSKNEDKLTTVDSNMGLEEPAVATSKQQNIDGDNKVDGGEYYGYDYYFNENSFSYDSGPSNSGG